MDEKAQLTERQKELNCIYRIDKLIAETNDVLTVLSASCGIIADATQYPCYTSVLIEYDGYSIKSPYFKPGKNKIQSKIFIDNIESGIIYTFYTHKLNNKEIEFLDEEKNLLDSVAARLSDFLLVKKIKNQTNTDESNRTNKFASIRLEILEKAKIDPESRIKDLDEAAIAQLNKIIGSSELPVEGELSRIVRQNIKRLQDIGSYRGSRHKAGLPVRGQRTSHNARTRKGKKKTVGGLKRKLTKT